jgi:hypothetical protein
VRWFVDLGADDYNLPGYFGSQRWNYYRMRAEGHNTLVLNPTNQPDQNPRAAAKIIRFDSKPQRSIAIADLTPAYAGGALQVERGIALIDRKGVLLQDQLRSEKPMDTWWFAHTPAQVTLNANATIATLQQNNKTLTAKILSPATARFAVMDATPLEPSPRPAKQNANRGIRKLAIHSRDVRDLRLVVWLKPGEADDSDPGIVSLDNW